MIKEIYDAFRSAGAEEEKAIDATDKLAHAMRVNESKLDFIKWGIVVVVALLLTIAVKQWTG